MTGLGLLVEVTPGAVKPWGLLSRRERRKADALARRKGKMLMRHGELLRELEPLLAKAVERSAEVDGPDSADTPALVSVIETGKISDLAPPHSFSENSGRWSVGEMISWSKGGVLGGALFRTVLLLTRRIVNF
jgi:hypothetical protein